MEQQPFFADVDLPFHVWVREGRRWVLRDAAPRALHEAARPAAGEAERRGADPPAGR
jgi:hypothetical protein